MSYQIYFYLAHGFRKFSFFKGRLHSEIRGIGTRARVRVSFPPFELQLQNTLLDYEDES